MASRKCKKEPFHVRLKKNRINATLRERQRLAKINQLLERLSDTVPQEFQGLATKVEIIRGVAEYIRILAALLQNPGLPTDGINTAHLVKKNDEFESRRALTGPNLQKAKTELHNEKDR
ncbi:Myogenic-determination protein [Holothuria leucospilota]|uniref:Myogenic-determination protein n=1 Tax=Holothuria leucospilota TaxID=206669 RepID=A0A9Q1HCR0_HOLLE|nr:Myogenic-determination protein [Holothuria leucospilota]